MNRLELEITRISKIAFFLLKHTYSDSPYMNLSSIFWPHPLTVGSKNIKSGKVNFLKANKFSRTNFARKRFLKKFGMGAGTSRSSKVRSFLGNGLKV